MGVAGSFGKYGLPLCCPSSLLFAGGGVNMNRELMPLAIDRWARSSQVPLAQGRLTGKVRFTTSPRQKTIDGALNVKRQANPGDSETLYRTVDVIDRNCGETGKTLLQIALNLAAPAPDRVVSHLWCAATELCFAVENLGAVGWNLTVEQLAKLDSANAVTPIYPYWHRRRLQGQSRSRCKLPDL